MSKSSLLPCKQTIHDILKIKYIKNINIKLPSNYLVVRIGCPGPCRTSWSNILYKIITTNSNKQLLLVVEIHLYLSNLPRYVQFVNLITKYKDLSTKWDIDFEHKWRISIKIGSLTKQKLYSCTEISYPSLLIGNKTAIQYLSWY